MSLIFSDILLKDPQARTALQSGRLQAPASVVHLNNTLYAVNSGQHPVGATTATIPPALVRLTDLVLPF